MTYLCPECFENTALQKRLIEIRPNAPDEKCEFHPNFKGIPIEDVADIIGRVIQNNYEHGRYDPGTDDFWGSDLQTIIEEATGAADDRVVQRLVHYLVDNDPSLNSPFSEYPYFSEDASYERNLTGFQGHSLRWREFRDAIISSQRFFNDRARELLDEIFKGIHLQQAQGSERPVYVLQPNDPVVTIFRARLAATKQDVQIITKEMPGSLAAPPLKFRRAGRMNPSGISAFYGAFDMPTCIAELRPPVGSFVVGAQFELTRPICVLDMTKFSAPFKEPDLFSKYHIDRTTQWRFMQRFMREISMPVSKDDEHLNYIPTQAVAEYLLYKHEFHLNGRRQRIEGIIFQSAQHPQGRNVVLLGDAGQVRTVSPPRKIPPNDPQPGISTTMFEKTSPGGLALKERSQEILVVSGASFTTVLDTSPELQSIYEGGDFYSDDDDDAWPP